MSSSAGLASLLPREAWQALLANGAVRRFEKGEILMRQGEPGSDPILAGRRPAMTERS